MRLESLSTFIIDRLVFRKEPKDKHVIRLSVAQDKEWFKSYSEDAPIELPPSNSSELVKLELLDMAIEHASTKKPAKLEHRYDDDFMWAFKELVKSNDLQWSNKYFKNLIKAAGDRIIRLKYKYNRPRPYQLAPHHDVDVKVFGSNTAKTPSFPSGHTAQSILVAKIIGDVYPQLKEDAMKIADDVSKSRIVGGHHFKSDIEFGEKIGMWLYNNLAKTWKK